MSHSIDKKPLTAPSPDETQRASLSAKKPTENATPVKDPLKCTLQQLDLLPIAENVVLTEVPQTIKAKSVSPSRQIYLKMKKHSISRTSKPVGSEITGKTSNKNRSIEDYRACR